MSGWGFGEGQVAYRGEAVGGMNTLWRVTGIAAPTLLAILQTVEEDDDGNERIVAGSTGGFRDQLRRFGIPELWGLVADLQQMVGTK
jgi:hypothetical protein